LPSRTAKPASTRSVRLKPANPFDLIRLIAHSQSDPRKALAELVQNSLDAGAGSITITRLRRRGEVAVAVFDDGSGVFSDSDRPEALERIATNIGHSFKRNLSPAERQQQMMLGKYGIGILGFWSVGRELEMRSRVNGSEVWALRLVRDEPLAEVFRLPQGRFALGGETWTEVEIRGVHPTALRQLVGRRLGDYLGSELRGQLLSRKVRLRIVDRVARGKALKEFLVVPQRFRGNRIEELDELAVPGHSPVRLEIYFVPPSEERRPAVSLTCGGTIVCDDIAALEGFDLGRPPWSLGVLEGIVEFPDLQVAPSTRRGFVPDDAAAALFQALASVEPRLLEVIREREDKERTERDEDLARELRKVFRPIAKELPQYDFFGISRQGKEPSDGKEPPGAPLGRSEEGPAIVEAEEDGHSEGGGAASDGAAAAAEVTEVVDEGEGASAPDELLPPGPLAAVRISPRKSRLLPGASRSLTAIAVDEAGRRIREGVEYFWRIVEGDGAIEPDGDRVVFKASESTGTARLVVAARSGGVTVEAEAEVEVVEKLQGQNPDAGIPDPELAFDPDGDWRSRVRGRRWEYNAAHPDYQAACEDPKRRFRYLVHLFAKEIVLWNYGEPKDERLLERMVEVLTRIKSRA
jgi:hypothetical protein